MLYANDILLMSPTITGLQNLLSACQELLDSLDMVINTKKSRCMRTGPRYDKSCANIVTSDGQVIPWADEVRYLGVYIVKSNRFRCSVEYAKRFFLSCCERNPWQSRKTSLGGSCATTITDKMHPYLNLWLRCVRKTQEKSAVT